MKHADKAFEDFVRARSPALVRYAYVLTGNPHDAADLAQEAQATLQWPVDQQTIDVLDLAAIG